MNRRPPSITPALLSLLAAAAAQAQSNAPARGSSAAPAAEHITNIREHDFRNGIFHADGFHTNVRLHDGSWNGHADENGDADWFAVQSVAYGDLDNDGVEEAAVVVSYTPAGGHGEFFGIDVFALRNGHALPIARIEEGDRADGGVYDADIHGGRLLVRVNGGPAARIVEWVDTQVLRLENDHLVQERVTDHTSFQRLPERGPARITVDRRFPGGTLVDGGCGPAPHAPSEVRWTARAHDRFVVTVSRAAGRLDVHDAHGAQVATGSIPGELNIEATADGELSATFACTAPSPFALVVRRATR